MNKEQLVKELKRLQRGGDYETNHILADEVLLKFINDKDIEEEFNKIEKWYA